MEERCCSNPSPTSLSKPSFQFWKFSYSKWAYRQYFWDSHTGDLHRKSYLICSIFDLKIALNNWICFFWTLYSFQRPFAVLLQKNLPNFWSFLDSHSFACKASGEFAIWAENIQKYAEVHIFKQLLMHSLKLKSCLLPGFEIAKIAKNFVPARTVRTVTRAITKFPNRDQLVKEITE